MRAEPCQTSANHERRESSNFVETKLICASITGAVQTA